MKSERSKAKEAGEKHYFTGLACKNGHIDKRYTCDGACMQCARDKAKRQAAKDPEKKKENLKIWRNENKEKEKEWRRAYVLSGKSAEACSRYREKNKEDVLNRTRAWRRRNPEKTYEATARRSKMRKLAMPSWYKKEDVRPYYKAAEILRLLGFDYHVDHIIPIKNPIVCGLHTPDNLQLLPAFDNLSKGNKFEMEQN